MGQIDYVCGRSVGKKRSRAESKYVGKNKQGNFLKTYMRKIGVTRKDVAEGGACS